MDNEESLKGDSQNVTNDGDMSEEDEAGYIEYYKKLQIDPPNVKELGMKIANFLERLVVENQDCESKETIFDIKQVANLKLKDYVKRIIDYSLNSVESWILSLVLLERFTEGSPGVYLNRHNIFK